MKRCSWAGTDDPLMLEYHDREWGVPVHDDRTHFEFLLLEGAQAGLSWSTILKKRDGYRRAFSEFDPERVARYTEKRAEKLMADPGIVRNRLKIASAVRNARAFLAVQKEFGSFDAYVWDFVDGTPKDESPEVRSADSRDDARVRRVEQGSQASRLQLRRLDGDLRVHAGGRTRERSSRRLLPARRGSTRRPPRRNADRRDLEHGDRHLSCTPRRRRRLASSTCAS